MFGKQMIFGAIGFAADELDFTVLEEMAKRASAAGASGHFQKAKSCAATLSRALSMLGGMSQTQTTRLSSLRPSDMVQNLKLVDRETPMDVKDLTREGWKVYTGGVELVYWDDRAQDWDFRNRLLSERACGIAVRKKIFSSGVELLF
jgi:hypothetical protein